MSFEITGKDFHKDGVTEIHDLSKAHVPEDIQKGVARIFHEGRLADELAKRKQRDSHKEAVI